MNLSSEIKQSSESDPALKPKILIVDDKPANILSMRTLLANVDAELHSATSGNEALSLMLRNQYAVVLADVHMPEMDGYELVELMRKNPDTVFTPVIFVTAMDSERKNIHLGYQVGAVDYLFKPIDKVALISKVKIFLSLYQQVIDLEKSIFYYKKFVGEAGGDVDGNKDSNTLPKVLVVDDREENLFAMRTILKKLPIELITVGGAKEALVELENHSFAVVLLDVQMPHMDGFELAEQMRTDPKAQITPIIFLTAINKDREHVFKGYESGAVDYIFKPVNPDILLSKVMTFTQIHRHRVELQQLIKEKNDLMYKIQAQNAQLGFMAFHDPLTQSANRAGFEDAMERTLNVARSRGLKFALLLIDLDHFKLINDVYGHDCGDIILQEAAKRMHNLVKKTDYVARLGGDEFAIILDNIDSIEDPASVAEKLVKIVSQTYTIKGLELKVGVSVGISCYPDDANYAESCTVQEIVHNADIAMFKAKETRNNRFEFYTEAFSAQHTEHLSIEAGLKFAIDRQEMYLTYQPRIDMRDGTVIGAEALLRWNHPEKGEISPGRFIPIAERSQMIIPIGNWVFAEACRQRSEWHSELPDNFRISVNISPYQLVDHNFVDFVKEQAEEFAVNPQNIEMELTESAVMEDTKKMTKTLDELHEIGFPIIVDDFGTGYSMLKYLKILPIEGLKIDAEFVYDLESAPENELIIKAIIALAENFDLHITGEGVETENQGKFLLDNGCFDAQGFLYSKSLKPDLFLKYYHSANK